MSLRAVRWIVMGVKGIGVKGRVRLMLFAAAGCRLGARILADVRELAGAAKGI
jgi:hypothetical protein